MTDTKTDVELPYLEETIVRVIRKYNPKYGDDRICECGHSYERHFDSYADMENVGCKYCDCFEFVEKTSNSVKRTPFRAHDITAESGYWVTYNYKHDVVVVRHPIT